MPTTRKHRNRVRRITDLFDSATPKQVAQGMDWYREANTIAADLSAGTSYSVEQTAGVIAVLSPNIMWSHNVSAARIIVDGHANGIDVANIRCAGYGANRRKAYAILDGDLSKVSGPKVTAFWKNILGDYDHVTVDSWAYLAAMGHRLIRDNGPTRVEHRLVSAAYYDAADLCDVAPAHLQAVVWGLVRGKYQ